MRVTTVKISYGRTFNLDDYESMRLDMEMGVDFDEDDSVETQAELIEGVWEALRAQVKANALPVLKVRDAKRNKLANQASVYQNGGNDADPGTD